MDSTRGNTRTKLGGDDSSLVFTHLGWAMLIRPFRPHEEDRYPTTRTIVDPLYWWWIWIYIPVDMGTMTGNRIGWLRRAFVIGSQSVIPIFCWSRMCTVVVWARIHWIPTPHIIEYPTTYTSPPFGRPFFNLFLWASTRGFPVITPTPQNCVLFPSIYCTHDSSLAVKDTVVFYDGNV